MTRHEHFSMAATAAFACDGRNDFRSRRAMKPTVENGADRRNVPWPASRGALVTAGKSSLRRKAVLLRRTHIA
jgi:hypothetical protein